MGPDFSEVMLTTRFRLGMRVVVRHRVGQHATDALGEVIGLTPETITVRTRRRGEVTIHREQIVLAKPVPPAPARRGRPHLAIGIADLQQLMVSGLPPLETQWLGRWMLRAADGYTGRGNSMLPVGDPGLPLEDAVEEVERWYAARGLPPLVQYFGPSGFDPADEPLGQTLQRRGWDLAQGPQVLVMTADAASVRASASSPPADRSTEPRITVSDHATDAWWSCASERALARRATAQRIFDSLADARYLTATRPGGSTLGAARLVVDSGWAGIFELQVHPEARRGGVGRALASAAASEALDLGATLLYLQVGADNEAAVSLYRSLGFAIHHEYHYARLPTET